MSDENDTSAEDQLILASAIAPDELTQHNVDCNRVWLEGSKTIPGFRKCCGVKKRLLFPRKTSLSRRSKPITRQRFSHTLGRDIETAKKVAALPPVKRAAAFAAIERGEPSPSLACRRGRRPRR